MNPYELTFSLDSQKKIIVPLKDPLTLIGWCDAEPVLFLQNTNIITLANGPTYFNIRDMRNFLKKALNNELQLHKSITSDIGYLLNGYHKNENGFIIERFESGLETWIGYKYHLWYAYENEMAYVTWIYNDNDKNIIFEITPSYPYFSCDPKKEPHYIPFKKWMLSYKPYLIAKLSRETAQQWLDQAEYIVKTVDDNINRWQEEYNQ